MYATTTSLEQTMIGVTFDSATTALASKMISRSEARINQGLSQRYDLTSQYFQTYTSVPPMVREMTETLAEGYMWKALSRGAKESILRGQQMISEILGKDTMNKRLGENGYLYLIANYQANLLDTAGAVIPDKTKTPFRIQSSTSNYTDTFDEGNEMQWKVSKTKRDDISDSKD